MTTGRYRANVRRLKLIIAATLMAGALGLVTLSCHHTEQPQAPLQVSSARPGPGNSGTGSTRPDSAATPHSAGFISSILDPRLGSLLRAGDRWTRSRGPERTVVDQVVLVPDMDSFLELIGTWDEHQYFPVLIDDPAWTLPFLRAFRPACVVRIAGLPTAGKEAARQTLAVSDEDALWKAAQRAVAKAWTEDMVPVDQLPPANLVPSSLSPTPPGLVISNPRSPMLAGAVALAAGRFQPLVRLDPVTRDSLSREPSGGSRFKTFSDVFSLTEARKFGRLIEALAATITGSYNRLGDRCDFLTLAGDWPYRYFNDEESGILRGEHALDDLIGRSLETNEGGLARSRSRWAFTGRLLGDPAASVYRAMCSLFLLPDSALLWNTYNREGNWSAYRMTDAASTLVRFWPRAMPPVHHAGPGASLSAWHQTFDPVNRFGWIVVNSSGAPRQFSIPGGSGIPADLPRGQPTVVSIIHSFSAANPLDLSTLAGRWLDNGAYVYFGAMNEPYLHAFRCPKLVTELASTEMPLSAVLRQGQDEFFDRPWHLVYLGDPLFQFRQNSVGLRHQRLAPERVEAGLSFPGRWTVTEITAKAQPLDHHADEAMRLRWCLAAAIRNLCQPGDPVPSEIWTSVLLKIDRQQLDPRLKPVLDELVTDTLLNAGRADTLLDRLLRIPPASCSPRNLRTIEFAAIHRLAMLAASHSVPPALDLWDRLIRRPWPSAEFPTQFTHRLGAVVDASPRPARELYRQRLLKAQNSLPRGEPHSPCVDLVDAELKRLGTSP